MPIKSVEQLKSWFRRGLYPTESNFADLIDSFAHASQKGQPNGFAALDAMGKLPKEQLPRIETLIPIDVTFDGKESDDSRHLKFVGEVPEGYTVAVFRKIRRTTWLGDRRYLSHSQWYFYSTATLIEEGNNRERYIHFDDPNADEKLKSPYKDHNYPPTPQNKASFAHDFLLVHNVDEDYAPGGTKGYPQKFRLSVSWGHCGKKYLFVNKGIGTTDYQPARRSFNLGIALVKTSLVKEVYRDYSRKARITLSDIRSNFVTFKIENINEHSSTPSGLHRHDYKPDWYFTK